MLSPECIQTISGNLLRYWLDSLDCNAIGISLTGSRLQGGQSRLQLQQLPDYSESRSRTFPLMQWRSPVGSGPSLKTCPRWPSQLLQTISVR
ncbi:MAG: hypothetical protein J07HR59_00962, partial [Halorubrum sp. J07HR59]